MDLTSLNTKDAAEHGAELHLAHPAMGHLLYSGEGADDLTGKLSDPEKKHTKVTVSVRGTESKTMRELTRANARARMMEKNPDPKHVPTEAEIEKDIADNEKSGIDLACALVIEFGGLTKDGKPMKATEENKREFFAQSEDLILQVVGFARDKTNFFAKGLTA